MDKSNPNYLDSNEEHVLTNGVINLKGFIQFITSLKVQTDEKLNFDR